MNDTLGFVLHLTNCHSVILLAQFTSFAQQSTQNRFKKSTKWISKTNLKIFYSNTQDYLFPKNPPIKKRQIIFSKFMKRNFEKKRKEKSLCANILKEYNWLIENRTIIFYLRHIHQRLNQRNTQYLHNIFLFFL